MISDNCKYDENTVQNFVQFELVNANTDIACLSTQVMITIPMILFYVSSRKFSLLNQGFLLETQYVFTVLKCETKLLQHNLKHHNVFVI